jgi:hypothetical protein
LVHFNGCPEGAENHNNKPRYPDQLSLLAPLGRLHRPVADPMSQPVKREAEALPIGRATPGRSGAAARAGRLLVGEAADEHVVDLAGGRAACRVDVGQRADGVA